MSEPSKSLTADQFAYERDVRHAIPRISMWCWSPAGRLHDRCRGSFLNGSSENARCTCECHGLTAGEALQRIASPERGLR